MTPRTMKRIAPYVSAVYYAVALFTLVYATLITWDLLSHGRKYSEHILPVELVWFGLTAGSTVYLMLQHKTRDLLKTLIAFCTGVITPMFLLLFLAATPPAYAPSYLYSETCIPRPTFHFSEPSVK